MSIRVIFIDPTVAGLAQALNDSLNETPDGCSQKVPISSLTYLRRCPSTKHAVLFLPTIFGVGSVYSSLASHLTISADILTCRLPGTGPDELPLTDMEALAAHCLAQMVNPAAHEEWSLIGWSFGGVLAYELARQMYARGLRVRQVILFDSYLPDRTRITQSIPQSEIEREFIRAFGADNTSAADLYSLIPVCKANVHALLAYSGGEYAGPLAQLQAEDTATDIRNRVHPFLRPLHAEGTSTRIVPGHHYSIIDPRQNPRFAQLFDELIRGREPSAIVAGLEFSSGACEESR
jgi:surfactin synthase thioesterase subunit